MSSTDGHIISEIYDWLDCAKSADTVKDAEDYMSEITKLLNKYKQTLDKSSLVSIRKTMVDIRLNLEKQRKREQQEKLVGLTSVERAKERKIEGIEAYRSLLERGLYLYPNRNKNSDNNPRIYIAELLDRNRQIEKELHGYKSTENEEVIKQLLERVYIRKEVLMAFIEVDYRIRILNESKNVVESLYNYWKIPQFIKYSTLQSELYIKSFPLAIGECTGYRNEIKELLEAYDVTLCNLDDTNKETREKLVKEETVDKVEIAKKDEGIDFSSERQAIEIAYESIYLRKSARDCAKKFGVSRNKVSSILRLAEKVMKDKGLCENVCKDRDDLVSKVNKISEYSKLTVFQKAFAFLDGVGYTRTDNSYNFCPELGVIQRKRIELYRIKNERYKVFNYKKSVRLATLYIPEKLVENMLNFSKDISKLMLQYTTGDSTLQLTDKSETLLENQESLISCGRLATGILDGANARVTERLINNTPKDVLDIAILNDKYLRTMGRSTLSQRYMMGESDIEEILVSMNKKLSTVQGRREIAKYESLADLLCMYILQNAEVQTYSEEDICALFNIGYPIRAISMLSKIPMVRLYDILHYDGVYRKLSKYATADIYDNILDFMLEEFGDGQTLSSDIVSKEDIATIKSFAVSKEYNIPDDMLQSIINTINMYYGLIR